MSGAASTTASTVIPTSWRRLKLVFRGYELQSFKSSVAQIYIAALQCRGIKVSNITRHPVKIKNATLHRSPFVHSKSRENFQRRTYMRSFYIEGDLIDTSNFELFLADNLHAGAACKVYENQFIPADSLVSLTMPLPPLPSAGDMGFDKLETMEDFEQFSFKLTQKELNASPSSSSPSPSLDV